MTLDHWDTKSVNEGLNLLIVVVVPNDSLHSCDYRTTRRSKIILRNGAHDGRLAVFFVLCERWELAASIPKNQRLRFG